MKSVKEPRTKKVITDGDTIVVKAQIHQTMCDTCCLTDDHLFATGSHNSCMIATNST